MGVTMKKREIGLTGISVSEIGLGCASYWGKERFDESQAINIVNVAIDKGVNLFDTGHSYSDGNAEIRLGKALKNISNKSDLVISSKAGTRIDKNGKLYKDFSPKWVRESCELSLKRLGLETLPLLHLHGCSLLELNDELIEELLRLKSDGLVRAIGVNTFDTTVLEKVLNLNIFDSVMLDYNILCREREPLIEKFYSKGIGVLAGASLADSLYSNRVFKVKGIKDLWYLARALKNFRGKLIKGFSYRFINNEPNITGSQIALAYVLSNTKICSAIFGTTSEKHLLENLDAINTKIPNEVMEKIQLIK